MINDFQLKRDKLSLSIIDSQLETGIEHVYYDIWKPLVSPQYDFTYGVQIIYRLLFDINMEKPCERCGIVTMTDDEHRICYDCFVELDVMDREEE